ncbi:MAG: hypothetical protein AAFV01_17340, partial [Bacteroidota bacterium]
MTPLIVFAMNTLRHRTSGFSPFELLFGRIPLMPSDVALATQVSEARVEFLKTLGTRLQQARMIANDLIELEYAKERADSIGPTSAPLYAAGDMVYAYLHQRTVFGLRRTRKLRTRWQRPYKIAEVVDSKTYKLTADDATLRRLWRRRHGTVINIEYLKPARVRRAEEPAKIGEEEERMGPEDRAELLAHLAHDDDDDWDNEILQDYQEDSGEEDEPNRSTGAANFDANDAIAEARETL